VLAEGFLTGAGAFTANGDLVRAYGDSRVSYIDCADIAACAAAVLTGQAACGGTHLLTGPQALSHSGIALIVSAAVGPSVSYVDMTAAELRATLTAQGLPPQFAAAVAALTAEVASGALSATTDCQGCDERTAYRTRRGSEGKRPRRRLQGTVEPLLRRGSASGTSERPADPHQCRHGAAAAPAARARCR
jgi:hypothetical protein